MMDLSTVDAALILSRGQYATVNGEYKTQMSVMQSWTQQAADHLRLGLQAGNAQVSIEHFRKARELAGALQTQAVLCEALKEQKDELYRAAWGK